MVLEVCYRLHIGLPRVRPVYYNTIDHKFTNNITIQTKLNINLLLNYSIVVIVNYNLLLFIVLI